MYVESRLPALLASVLGQEARRLALGYVWAGETCGSAATAQTPAGSRGITAVSSRFGKSISTLTHRNSRVGQPPGHPSGTSEVQMAWVLSGSERIRAHTHAPGLITPTVGSQGGAPAHIHTPQLVP